MNILAPRTRRADPPRIPPSTRSLDRAAQDKQIYLRKREGLESRSIVRGLILLALLVLIASMARAGFGRVFVAGWWRP
jgi:hypothetical protein